MSEPVLAIESATPVVSVALLRGETLVGEERAPLDAAAAETLLPTVDALLARAGLPVQAIRAYAVSVGPGSFTSLRIGIATVKGLAFGSGRRVAPVPTLAALARAAGEAAGPVVGVLDARRGEVYAGAWSRGGEEPHAAVPEGIYTPEALAARLPSPCVLVGEGVALLDERTRARLGAGVRLVPASAAEPAARHVGWLGVRLLARGMGIDAADLVASYGRRAEAEVRRTGVRFDAGRRP